MYFRTLFNFLLILLAIVLATFFLNGLGLFQNTGNIINDSPVVKIIAGGVFALLMTFFIFERWRKIETEIKGLNDSRNTAVKEIKDEVKERIDTYFEDKTRKIEALHSKVDRISEDHPWLASITENELIPNVPSCKIVLKTASKFLEQDKEALVYEYLYSYLKKKSDDKEQRIKLEGTIDDFFDLAEFCEQELDDEYLSFLVIRELYENSGFSLTIAPLYIKKLIRASYLDEAKKVSDILRRYIFPSWWHFVLMKLSRKTLIIQPSNMAISLIALSLMEAAQGNSKKAKYYVKKVEIEGSKIKPQTIILCGEAEVALLLGKREEANHILDEINKSDCSTDDYYEIVRLYLLLGDYEKSNLYQNKIAEIRLKNSNPRKQKYNSHQSTNMTEINQIKTKENEFTTSKETGVIGGKGKDIYHSKKSFNRNKVR